MMKQSSVRMTSRHHSQLLDHLFPGDGREAVAIAICGRSEGPTRETLLVQQIEPVPYSICQRGRDFITWPTEHILPLLDKAAHLQAPIGHPLWWISFRFVRRQILVRLRNVVPQG